MKVLVTELPLIDLNSMRIRLKLDGQIDLLEFDHETPKRFVIDERLTDIDMFINIVTNQLDNEVVTPLWALKASFIRLMWSIKRQRELGYKISELEYMYLKIKDSYNLSLISSNEVSWYPEKWEEAKILVGKTDYVEFEVYSDIEDSLSAYIFRLKYRIKTKYLKQEKIITTKIIRYSYEEALKSIDELMNNTFEIKGTLIHLDNKL